jgi:hypothetical protein
MFRFSGGNRWFPEDEVRRGRLNRVAGRWQIGERVRAIVAHRSAFSERRRDNPRVGLSSQERLTALLLRGSDNGATQNGFRPDSERFVNTSFEFSFRIIKAVVYRCGQACALPPRLRWGCRRVRDGGQDDGHARTERREMQWYGGFHGDHGKVLSPAKRGRS